MSEEPLPDLIAVCSARTRPMTQNGNRSYFLKTGAAAWGRDVYHIRNPRDDKLTICGRDCSEYLTIGRLEKMTDDCCKRCSAKVAA